MNPPRRFLLQDNELSGQFRLKDRMERCGFCSLLSTLLRRAMCVGSRRGSSESYYRELGDWDIPRPDQASGISEDLDAEDEFEFRPEIHAHPNDEEQEEVEIEVDEEKLVRQVVVPQESHDEVLHEAFKMEPKCLTDSRFLTIHKRRKKRLLTRSLQRNTALLDDLSLGQIQCILNQSVQWKFNAFTLDNVSGGRCLPFLCVHLFQMYGLLSHFKLDAAKAWKLFSLIEEGYHSSNPYHNSIHAADVTQAMHCFLQQTRIRTHLQPLEIMASLLAAIAHDLDHPGVNQPFLIATSNHLARLYKNTSVLENHHWRSAISCLIESGLLDQMQESRAQLEKQIRSLILATDITRQQEYLSQFKSHLDKDTMDLTKAEHRHLVLQIALKCADISNPCRPWEISHKWSLKVCEEFFRQGDYEKQLNLPVTALCDRHNTSIPKIQTGFFKFVVTPLIKEWDRFLKNDLSSQMLDNLLYNQNKWNSLDAQETAEETRTEMSEIEIVDDDLETNISDSAELLLPLRRSSLNPTKQGALKEQLRRFSVPLNVFQDSKFKSRGEKSRVSSGVTSQKDDSGSVVGSEHSIHSQLSLRGQCEHTPVAPEKVLSTEKLLPDTSIASITTPVQATRLNTVIRDGGSWKLVRQQTFPPLETRDHFQASRSLHTSNEDAIYTSCFKSDLTKFDIGACWKEGKLSSLFSRGDTDKTDSGGDSHAQAPSELPRTIKEQETKKREFFAIGSQLRDNLTTVQLGGLDTDHLLRRRKSMPADSTPKEKKVREVTSALPQLLRRTLSGKDSWLRRRGSAPSPIADSELRGLTALGSLRHSVNGGRRKNPIATCQQWIAKTTYSVQEKTFHQLPRRSSLPVEVMTGISSC